MYLSHILTHTASSHWLECGVIPNLCDHKEEWKPCHHYKYLLTKHMARWFNTKRDLQKHLSWVCLKNPTHRLHSYNDSKTFRDLKKKKGEQVFSLDLSFKAHGKNVGERRPAAGGESLGCLCLACTGPFQPLRLCDSVFSAHYLHRSYTQSWFRHIFKWKLSLNVQVASLQFSITFWLLTIKTEAFSIFFNLLWFPGLFATSLPTSSPVTKHRDRMHRVSSKSLVLPGQRHCNHRS